MPYHPQSPYPVQAGSNDFSLKIPSGTAGNPSAALERLMKKSKRKKRDAGLGLLRFQEQFGEQAGIQHLAKLRWPEGFCCALYKGIRGYQHRRRPRVWECAECGHQESVTAGTVMHKTRTPLRVWFMAAYLMGRHKRGVSAMFLARELGLCYETAWHRYGHVAPCCKR